MLTLFSVPKPFEGRIAEIQRNALHSWVALGDDVHVVLLGDEQGTAEAARACGAEHVPSLLRNEHVTPRLDSAFAQVDTVARHPLRCFVNADVILLDDFLPAVRRVAAATTRFLMIGRTVELESVAPSEAVSSTMLRARAAAEGVTRGAAALDYFVFPREVFAELPPFLVGRAGFDNWLVWRARQQGPVIDATRAVLAIHQAHHYGHLAGGKEEAYYGEDAAWNSRLVGGRGHIYTIHDASHRLGADGGLTRNLGAVLRTRENLRRGRAKMRLLLRSRIRVAR